MPSPARSAIAVVVCAALLAATVWLLDQFAQYQFSAHLRDQAARALALNATGDTPYRWQLRRPDDIVAGRVFGAADVDFSGGELAVRSSGPALEIGLPLTRAVDLRRFPHLQMVVESDTSAAVQAVVRERLDAPERVNAATNVPTGAHSLMLDLAAPTWESGEHEVKPPRSAAMLRLRFNAAAGTRLRLRTIVLERITDAQRIDLAQPPHIVDPDATVITGMPLFRLPLRQQSQKVDIDAISRNTNVHMPLLILLPQRGRVEQQIDLRNAVFAAQPGAILIPENAVDATFAQARDEIAAPATAGFFASHWLWLAAYALILGYCRWHPPRAPRLRAFMEIVLTMAGPLWLILGGHFDGNPDTLQKLLIALSLAYAISLSMRRHWQWNGSARAWLLAAAIVVFAALIGLAAHRPDDAVRAVGAGHIARYLAWALLQQYLICAVCAERWQIVTGNAVFATYLGALGFALMHTPNAALMLATLAGGLCWCALYLRERALLPLAVSHAVSALVLLALLPTDILASAEVSARFFQ
ncbi:MAG: CPBP family intramembrane metalloprotease [Rudaea sp.]|nr:CPBP family intramembrane metalloprotease [Rudaea sp.]